MISNILSIFSQWSRMYKAKCTEHGNKKSMRMKNTPSYIIKREKVRIQKKKVFLRHSEVNSTSMLPFCQELFPQVWEGWGDKLKKKLRVLKFRAKDND